jgi:hypothetical protein
VAIDFKGGYTKKKRFSLEIQKWRESILIEK